MLPRGFKFLKSRGDIARSEIKRFSRFFFPSVFGNSTAQLSSFIDTWLASFLVSGSISYLFYANRLFQLPLALFAIAASTALFPTVSKLLKNGKTDEAIIQSRSVLWLLVALLGGATAIGVLLSTDIVKLLFQRGLFDIDDTRNTSAVLVMYLVGLLPFGLSKLFSLWLYAMHRQADAAKIAAMALGINIIFSILLIAPLEAAGLALASSISGWALLFLTARALGKDIFLDIMRSKYAPYALLFILLCMFGAWGIKVLTNGYF